MNDAFKDSLLAEAVHLLEAVSTRPCSARVLTDVRRFLQAHSAEGTTARASLEALVAAQLAAAGFHGAETTLLGNAHVRAHWIVQAAMHLRDGIDSPVFQAIGEADQAVAHRLAGTQLVRALLVPEA